MVTGAERPPAGTDAPSEVPVVQPVLSRAARHAWLIDHVCSYLYCSLADHLLNCAAKIVCFRRCALAFEALRVRWSYRCHDQCRRFGRMSGEGKQGDSRSYSTQKGPPIAGKVFLAA